MREEIVDIRVVQTAIIYPQTINQKILLQPEQRLEETVNLAAAINLKVNFCEIIRLRQIHPDAFFGKGMIDRFRDKAEKEGIELFIVDANLTPVQQRNLEKSLNLKVIDRTALILEIFGERAKTKEGVLQVELAHLTYQRSRLVRSWTHLERQRGGAGFLGGPGETQIELDRRLIDEKINKIKKALEKIRQTRGLQRTARKRVPYPIVALVGYTNAGKSTLFNQLTSANVFAKDLLFATLDTTMRRVKLPSGRDIILSDTVGFISDLPHELIAAFRATLEEVLEADIIIQVLDASSKELKQQRLDVLEVLHKLGLEKIEYQSNYLEVYNKIDLLSSFPSLSNKSINISALNGTGCEKLLQRVDEILDEGNQIIELTVSASNGRLLAWLYEHGKIISNRQNGENLILKICLSPVDQNRLKFLLKNQKN